MTLLLPGEGPPPEAQRAPGLRNGWTGAQYSLLRVAIGAAALGGFIAWLAGGQTERADFADVGRFFPNVLWASDAAFLPVLLASLGAAASLLVIVGFRDRWAALLAWYCGTALALGTRDASGGLAPLSSWGEGPSYELLSTSFVLLLHAFVARAPYGSLDARGRIDPRGGWTLSPLFFGGMWILLTLAHGGWAYVLVAHPEAACATVPCAVPSVRAFLWLHAAVGIAFVAFVFWRPARRWLWLAWMAALSGDALVNGQGSVGSWLLPFFVFDPGWIPAKEAPMTDLLFYDGSCGLCHKTVRFILSEDRSGTAFRFAPLEGDTWNELVPEETRRALPDSIVVRRADGARLTKSDAVLHVAARLGGLWRVLGGLGRLVPRPLRDVAYDGVARVRKKLFAAPPTACPILPPELRARFDQ